MPRRFGAETLARTWRHDVLTAITYVVPLKRRAPTRTGPTDAEAGTSVASSAGASAEISVFSRVIARAIGGCQCSGK